MTWIDALAGLGTQVPLHAVSALLAGLVVIGLEASWLARCWGRATSAAPGEGSCGQNDCEADRAYYQRLDEQMAHPAGTHVPCAPTPGTSLDATAGWNWNSSEDQKQLAGRF